MALIGLRSAWKRKCGINFIWTKEEITLNYGEGETRLLHPLISWDTDGRVVGLLCGTKNGETIWIRQCQKCAATVAKGSLIATIRFQLLWKELENKTLSIKKFVSLTYFISVILMSWLYFPFRLVTSCIKYIKDTSGEKETSYFTYYDEQIFLNSWTTFCLSSTLDS